MPDVRELLERESTSVDLEPGHFDRLLGRRDRKRRNQRIRAGVLAIALALLTFAALARAFQAKERTGEPRPDRSEDNFAPIAGWIAYGLNEGFGPGFWAVDPAPSEDPDRVALSSEDGTIAVGWSRDGTALLIRREIGNISQLSILHADGTETEVVSAPMILGPSISPDGSQVVYYTEPWTERQPAGLSVVGADGGPSVLLLRTGFSVASTFSPDGTQIAFVDEKGEPVNHRVWVVNADGTDAHVIVDETAFKNAEIDGLDWSPTGDRIAIGMVRRKAASIYTFAPDGSRFTRVIEDGVHPTWSPDGTRIAFARYLRGGLGNNGDIVIVDPDAPDKEYVISAGGPPVWHPGP
jgi:hypothetical protein